jgi:hypothetical protein
MPHDTPRPLAKPANYAYCVQYVSISVGSTPSVFEMTLIVRPCGFANALLRAIRNSLAHGHGEARRDIGSLLVLESPRTTVSVGRHPDPPEDEGAGLGRADRDERRQQKTGAVIGSRSRAPVATAGRCGYPAHAIG